MSLSVGAYRRHKAVKWAMSKRGIKEHPPGSNRGPQIDDWQREFGMLGEPWCGAFVGYAMKVAGKRPSSRIVYCPYIYIDGRARRKMGGAKLTQVPYSKKNKGDIILFDFQGDGVADHVGMYVGDGMTIEGNTSLAGSQDNGGMVCLKKRMTAETPSQYVLAVIRWA